MKEIIPPIANYHNLILDISNEINEIFFPSTKTNNKSNLSEIELAKKNELLKESNIVFNNESIVLFGLVVIRKNDGDTVISFLQDINIETYEIYATIINNFMKLKFLYERYFYILTVITSNYDLSVSNSMVNVIFNTVLNKNNKNKTYNFLLPYKNKIGKILDHTIENLFNRYEYMVSFKYKTNNFINYKILKVMLSDLSPDTNLENLRYFDKETLKEGNIDVNDFELFLKNLFYYGEFI